MTLRSLPVALILTGCFSDLDDGGDSGAFTTSEIGELGSSETDPMTTFDEGASTTGATSNDGDTSTGGSFSTTQTAITTDTASEPESDLYQQCTADDECNEFCIWTDGVMEGIAPDGFCSQPCNSPVECPVPLDGTAVPLCSYYGGSLACKLGCHDGLTCPAAMTCMAIVYTLEGTLMDVCL